MAVQCLVLIHPRELEIPSIQDFAALGENATTKDLPFSKEKTEAGDDPIALEKPGPEDLDTAETDDVEKARMANDATPEKATNEVVANTTPRKVSTEITEIQTQEVSLEKAEMAVQEDSTELAANKDFQLVIAEALKKVDLKLST